ncbi:lipoprotein signal peptidase [Paenibacillus pini JCM 16418]|uniref:Lipoprotein signal peptidase n=1 Tax=Paenibacillus pini JCM 16418 TaxID=1236976 RepID=W7YXK2_9BACL|nr:lipoprotein signal peptidase [Paenibacillus pini JCM 16418]
MDRALTGEVVDFLQLNFGSYTFPIFNIADSCIVIGVALIILDSLFDMKQESLNNKSHEGNEEV